jgi:hypothetical protein
MLKNGRVAPGTPFRVTCNFEDGEGDDVDPTTVTLKTISPCGTERSYVYGTDSEVQKDSTGNYYGDITPDRAGRWRFRWESTGAFTTTAIEDSFIVQASQFSPYGDNDCWDYR